MKEEGKEGEREKELCSFWHGVVIMEREAEKATKFMKLSAKGKCGALCSKVIKNCKTTAKHQIACRNFLNSRSHVTAKVIHT